MNTDFINLFSDAMMVNESHLKRYMVEGMSRTASEASLAQYVAQNERTNSIAFLKPDPEVGFRSVGRDLAEDDEVIAVLAFRGVGTSDGYYGVPGYVENVGRINFLKNEKRVKALIVAVESPGGSTYRLNELTDALANFEKPTIGYVNGLACSAGYWMVASCNQVIANHRMAQVGSIGTMINYLDIIGIFEKWGAKMHTVVSDNSPEKNESSIELRKGNYAPAKRELNAITDQFQEEVQAARPKVKLHQMKGGVYNAVNAIPGLVDAISPMPELVNSLLQTLLTRKS